MKVQEKKADVRVEKSNPLELAGKVRDLLKQNLSVEDAAKQLGVNKATVYKYRRLLGIRRKKGRNLKKSLLPTNSKKSPFTIESCEPFKVCPYCAKTLANALVDFNNVPKA